MRGHQGRTYRESEIRQGIDRFYSENGHFPTAWDFDLCVYLPTARSLQRIYGGLEKMRRQLGYTELNYTKGPLRSVISTETWATGISAEDALEKILTDQFGEPYVHTQRRYYKKLRNRYDFFVYYHGGRFGVDVFTTSRYQYIGNNVRHKVLKYKDVPKDIPIFFVVSCPDITARQVDEQAAKIGNLTGMDNVRVIHEQEFIEYARTLRPLTVPDGFVGALED